MILQVSSGSSGKPVRAVYRTLEDILSINSIIQRAWERLFPVLPRRVALLGGISHGQAVRHLEIRGTRFESFELTDKGELQEFDPEFLACYPSILRELVADRSLHLRALKAVKLGGERVFASDIAKLQSRYPSLPVIEQLGSTELPALAMGLYRGPADPRKLELQRQRFSFQLESHSDWQPLVARDDFSPQSTEAGFLHTGDVVRMEKGAIVDIKRADDCAAPYFEAIEKLLDQGCINVQLDTRSREVRFDGPAPSLARAGLDMTLSRVPPRRLPHSNKLPLVI
jgi:hypothetical protein